LPVHGSRLAAEALSGRITADPMPHPEVVNRTEFAHEPLLLTDEDAMPQFVALVQGSYSISTQGEVAFLPEQPPPNPGGEWIGDPGLSSMRLEPQIAFEKLATDIVMLGSAHAPRVGTTRMQVGIRVGSVQKLVDIVGTRYLVKSSGGLRISEPEPFETIPLTYEHAFGGWDRRAEDPQLHRYEARNPVGVGFRDGSHDTPDELVLPNIEDPGQPFRSYGDTPPPAGFGFIAPNWQPRLDFAGTFDAAWDRSRKPLLPTDFNRQFFNAASPGLVAPGFLRGDEPVVTVGASAGERIAFHLPQEPPPDCIVELRGRNRVELRTVLDTVIVDMDRLLLILQWRAHYAVRNGMDDVVSIEILRGFLR
jgi:hypothetical protein